jgi:tRNA threonylcarbamoyladenosine biosynthesis protein TsaE
MSASDEPNAPRAAPPDDATAPPDERAASASETVAPAGGGAARALDVRVAVPTAAGMRDLGERLAGLLRAGDLVVLSGPLGAGKTTLTQGIGAGLHVRGPVTSPTFVIARVHPALRGGPGLVHADAYRLGSRAEVDDLDLDTDLDSSVTVVEWGEGLVEKLAPSFLEVAIAAPEPQVAPDQPSASTGQRSGSGGQPPGDIGQPPGDTDEIRVVRVVGRGDRWRSAEQAMRQALASAPDAP